MNIRIAIIRECCDWYGVAAPEAAMSYKNFDVDVDSSAKKAFSLICHYLSSPLLKDYAMPPEELSRYFQVSVKLVLMALNARDLWNAEGSYSMIKGKVYTTIINLMPNNDEK